MSYDIDFKITKYVAYSMKLIWESVKFIEITTLIVILE